MQDLAPVLFTAIVAAAIGLPIIIKMVFKHQVDLAEINSRAGTSPQVLAEIQELKKQVADLRELVTDIAINTPAASSVQERIREQEAR